MAVVPTHPIFLLSPMEDTTERSPFWHNEVIEAELQAVLNTFTEHDFQHALKKMAEALGRGRGILLG
jgi:hypothetical protein